MLKRWTGLAIWLAFFGAGALPLQAISSLPSPTQGSVQATPTSTKVASATVPSDRLGKLKRGINLSHWFSQRQSYESDKLLSFITAQDISLIWYMGLSHVRLPIDPDLFLDENQPKVIKPGYIHLLDAALAMINSQGVAVVLDLQPSDAFKKRLATDPEFVITLAKFWRTLASRYQDYSPENLFFEILNEPHFTYFAGDRTKGIAKWNEVQSFLAAAIRLGAPRHTIIATSAGVASIGDLVTIQPLSDRNVVYTFHLYNPRTFTHQGASWTPPYSELKNLPYPSNPDLCFQSLSKLQAEPKATAEAYCQEKWNAAKLESLIKIAADWSKQNDVPVIAGEFGAYSPVTPRDARVAWIKDVRSLLEKYGIGWTMWDYAGGFPLTQKAAQGRQIDPEVANALGLK